MGGIRELPPKKFSLNMDFFLNRSDPPPPRVLEILGHFSESPIFFGTFGALFCVLIHQIFGKKFPETFGFGLPRPPFSTRNSKIVGAKKVPKNFCIASEPHPPILEEIHNPATFFVGKLP